MIDFIWYFFAGVGVLIFISGLVSSSSSKRQVAPECAAHRDLLTEGKPKEIKETKTKKTVHKPNPSKRRQPRAPWPSRGTIFHPKSLPKNHPDKRR